MTQRHHIAAPDGLEDLGLSQDQLRSLQGYFALQYRFAKQQRMALLGMAVAVVGAMLLPLTQDDTLPFISLVDWIAQWLPALAVLLGSVSIGIAIYTQNLADKRLPELDLSDEAVQRVRGLARAMNRVVIFSFKNV